MENKEIRKANLAQLLDEYTKGGKLTKAAFAEKCGLVPAQISQLLGEKSFRNIGDRTARKVEESLGLPNGWMDSIHEKKTQVDANVSNPMEYKPSARYPVLSKVQAGAWTEAVEVYSLKDVDMWLESDAHTQGYAFWLQVEGDSMTAPVGLSIPAGTFVLFDTGREAVNGSLIVAKLTDDNEATFKKLIIDGSHKYLKGLNPQWPMLPVNGNCKVLGVAIETKLRLV